MLITLARKGEFVDLVTLDERGERIPWLWKQKIVQSCVAAGLHFELCYATALASSEYRRQVIL
jgi:RNase P/RNase MRP subunit p30